MGATHPGPLKAAPGDRLVIRGHHVGEHERDGEILEVLGEDGAPPYVVRWEDTGHVSHLYPSSDAYVQHSEHKKPPSKDNRSSGTAPSEAEALAADWEAATPPKDS